MRVCVLVCVVCVKSAHCSTVCAQPVAHGPTRGGGGWWHRGEQSRSKLGQHQRTHLRATTQSVRAPWDKLRTHTHTHTHTFAIKPSSLHHFSYEMFRRTIRHGGHIIPPKFGSLAASGRVSARVLGDRFAPGEGGGARRSAAEWQRCRTGRGAYQ